MSPETVELGVGDKDYWTKETKRTTVTRPKKKKKNQMHTYKSTEQNLETKNTVN